MEPTRGKAKRRTRKIKMYIQDFTEAEWDEGIKSIYLLFLFSKSSFHVLQSKSFCRCFSSPPTQVIFSFSVFFFLFFIIIIVLFFLFAIISGKKRKKNIYSAVEIMKTDVMNLL